MALVRHARGLRASYDSTQYQDYLYFATDTGEILLNGVTYGLSSQELARLQTGLAGSIKQVDYNESTRTFTITYGNNTTSTLVLPIASSTVAGLMTSSEKSLLTNAGSAGGVATLDSNGKVPTSQLPGTYLSVSEYASVSAFPATGTSGVLYYAIDSGISYLWTGSAYAATNNSLALGQTASTAYPGNLGKKNAEDIAALAEDLEEHIENINRVYDGGNASSLYGGSRVINCGGAAG